MTASKSDLGSVRLNGTDSKHLLRLPAIGELVPSPDEQWVAYTLDDNVYVTPMPGVVTKGPAEVSLKRAPYPFRLPLTGALEFVRAKQREAVQKAKSEGAGAAAAKDDKADKKPTVPASPDIELALTAPRS